MLLQEIEDFFKSKSSYRIATPEKFCCDAVKKFGLKLLSTAGTTRVVFKKPRSRSVIKVGFPMHNKSEKAVWEALRGSSYESILAPCYGISKEGYVLEQKFISKPIPMCRENYYWFNDKWINLRKTLESQFHFLLGRTNEGLSDFHEENIRILPNGDMQIIDYSHLCWEYFKDGKSSIEQVVKKVRKYKIPNTAIKMSYRNRTISLSAEDSQISINIDQI